VKYFLIYLFLEVMVSVNIASSIGAFATFAEIVLSAVLGIVLLVNFRVTLMQNLNALMQRHISVNAFQKLNLWSIVGALLFILPGFLGDIVALLLQFGFITTLFASKAYHVKEEEGMPSQFKQGKNSEIIDVEVIDEPRLK